MLRRLPFEAVPHQARRSGASLDAARSYRSRKAIMDRGRWSSQNSLLRYEKHARVGQSLNSLDPTWRAYCEVAERQLADMFLGRLDAATLALPAIPASIQSAKKGRS